MEREKQHTSVQEKNEFKIDNDPDKKVDLSKVKKNPWMILSIVLGLIVLVLLFFTFKGGISGNVVKGDDAGKKLVEFLNGKTGGGVEYVSYTDKGDIYEVMVSYQGQEIPVYITKDGEYFVQGATPLTGNAVGGTNTTNTANTAAKDVPKSDKPKVEAFIFSYCPYGTQFEKALIPVYDLLKNKADINIVAIGAMHGEYEHVESLRQICIEKNYGKDKLFKYLKAFNENSAIGSCGGTDTCVNPLIEKIYTSLSINKNTIESCMAKDAEALYQKQNARASELGISGSPTFVINGVEVSVSRTPDSIKQAVCNAFNTAPSECSQTLSTASPSAGFGASSGSSASAASCG